MKSISNKKFISRTKLVFNVDYVNATSKHNTCVSCVTCIYFLKDLFCFISIYLKSYNIHVYIKITSYLT